MANTPSFECYAAYGEIDRERKGFLLLLPMDKVRRSMVENRSRQTGTGMERDAADGLALFLAGEIDLHADRRRRIALLFAQRDFNIREAFEIFDFDFTGFIPLGNFVSVFHEHHMPLTEDEAKILFWRFDRDRDGFLSFPDFVGIFFTAHEMRKLRLPDFVRITPPRLLFTNVRLEAVLGSDVVDLPFCKESDIHPSARSRDKRRRPLVTWERLLIAPYAGGTSASPEHKRNPHGKTRKALLAPPTCCEFCRAASLMYPSKRAVQLPVEIPGTRACGNTGPCPKALAVAFEVEISMGREVERNRKDLALRKDFTLIQFWKMFDPQNKGFVTNYELKKTLRSLGIEASIPVVNLFLQRYGSVSLGRCKRITYAEICSALMPQEAHLSQMLRNRVSDSGPGEFSRATLFHVTELLQNLLQAEVQAESIRHEFASSTMFEPFCKIDAENHRVVCSKTLTQYLNRMGVFATPVEISRLLDRYDKGGTGVMSFNRTAGEISFPSV
ncbi:ef hand domain-containing, partial [Cystoisospora suis]